MKTDTDTSRMLDYLRSGNTLTVGEAWERFKSTSLRQRVYDWRKAGHPITEEWIENNGKRYVRYRYGEQRQFTF